MEQGPRVSQLVVIGASAGGIEALSKLLSTLPSDFPGPIVIAQHLDPTRASHLQAILARNTQLPVRTVEEHEPLASGVVYVVPSNRHVEIDDHHVGVRTGEQPRPKPSVDLLFGTAAAVFGERLFAVILTGTGSDGADGARQVKALGGTVIVQNPATASFPGMPLSLAPTTVDVVADLEAIGPLLHDLLTDAYTPQSPAENGRMRALLDQLRTQTGIDFSRYRQPTIQRRLQRRMADTGKQTLEEYLRYVQQHPGESERLVNSFLIKVTDFFRDPELFDHLRERVLPELLDHARAHGGELRIWSAGCATGEEAYSLAILTAELLGDELEEFTVRIFATDVDSAAVAYARRGVYPASALKDLPPDLVSRYFTALDSGYEVKKSVRRLTVFAPHDLGQRAPFPRIDLATCRNVLMYFTPELQQRALQLFAFSLRSGGRLILGKSETASPLAELFSLKHPRLKVYRRQGDRVLIPPAAIKQVASRGSPRPAAGSGLAEIELGLTRAHRARTRPQSPAEAAERLLLELPIGVVVVDRRYDVQAINAAARRLLGIHAAAIGEDLIHLARRVPATELREAIDRAFRGQASAERYDIAPLEGTAGERRTIEVSCSPQQAGTDGEPAETVVLLLRDVTPGEQQRPAAEPEPSPRQRELERLKGRLQTLAGSVQGPPEVARALDAAGAALDAAAAEIERLSTSAHELRAVTGELVTANQDLATANAELHAQNEQLLVADEEAQAAVEEVETLSEEQQASNEELETLNEELQATVEELNTTNDDLEARGLELQDTAVSLEAERSRLSAILNSMAEAVVAVDPAGQQAITNPAFERMFSDFGPDFVPEDAQGRPLPPEAWPRRRAAAGETFSIEFTLSAPDGTRRWFHATGRPIEIDGHEGGIVVIRDITDRGLLQLQEQFMAMAGHELRTPLTALHGYLQLLLRQLSAETARETLVQSAGVALQQAERLRVLVDQLLDVTRVRSGKLVLARETVDLVVLAARVIGAGHVIAQGQAIELDADGGPLLVAGDPARLEDVLLNLITNAIKYAPDTERIVVSLRREGDQAEVRVRDWGPGISAADLPHIFSQFYQAAGTNRAAQGGLGLGLFIAHGGDVAVDSEEGKGATFTVRLPALTDGG